MADKYVVRMTVNGFVRYWGGEYDLAGALAFRDKVFANLNGCAMGQKLEVVPAPRG